MRNRKTLSLKYFYFTSSFAVALVACSVIGLLLFFASRGEMLRLNERQTLDKLNMFANDMQRQQQVMLDISYDITAKVYYKKYYYERNPYYDLELLREFEKYKNSMMIADDYFLMYRDNSHAYRSTNRKYQLSDILISHGLPGESERLYAALNTPESPAILPCGEENPGLLLFAFPVYTAGKLDASGYASLGFFISAQKLLDRMQTLAGNMEGELFLI